MAYKREPIQYFVFMKAETTGRQWEDCQKTKIVELTFIAVNRKDLEKGEAKKMPAAHKMNLVFCPERYIQGQATEAHDISDEYVRNALTFKQSACNIVAFLKQFPKPVCLVAHNGFAFDFKHLKGEIDEAEILFPEDLLCVDSRWLFHYMLKDDPEIKKIKTSLPVVYQKLFFPSGDLEKWVEPTTAEEKALMLLDCALLKKEAFLELADQKCKLFSEVLPVGGKRT